MTIAAFTNTWFGQVSDHTQSEYPMAPFASSANE